jgi:predicted MFS family arabinose efflux permease
MDASTTAEDGQALTMSKAAEFRLGWPIILAAVFGVGVGLTGLPFFTFGTFIKPLGAAFHWSRSQVALGSVFLHAGTAISSPFLGRVIDHYGPRTIGLVSMGGLVIGFGVVALSGPSLLSFYIAWSVLALLGCGTTPLAWTRMVNMHFDRGRGLALGLTLMGTGLASIFGPPLCGMLIHAWGWRAAYVGLGAFVLVVALPITATASWRRKPPAALRVVDKTGLTLREAAATRTFWLIACGFLLVVLSVAGAIVNLVPLLTDRGMAPSDAAARAGLMGVAVVAGRVLAGYLSDRFHAPYVAAGLLVLPAIGMTLLALTPGVSLAVPAVILIGLAGGAEVDLLAFLSSRYFGLRHYGVIYGVNLTVFAVAAATGPVAAAAAFDHMGTYGPALTAGAAMCAIGSGLLLLLGRYPREALLHGDAA